MKKFVRKLLLSTAGAGMAGATVLMQTSGAYTIAQADRGAAVFNTSCSVCHGQDLVGGPTTPSLVGPAFMFGWKQKNAAELQAYIKTKMPPGDVGNLSDQQYADIVAFMLKANGQSPSAVEVPADPAAAATVRIAGP
jgi:S-disulfanyl-L-cysteine oxidoreductase SoxD